MARISGEPTPVGGPWPDPADPRPAGLFARAVHDYVARRAEPIALLEAGCGRPACELGLGRLCGEGVEIRVAGVDTDDPITRRVSAARDDLHSVTLGDLRTVPLPPRSFDLVHCAGLLDRIKHVELVLDRFVAALKPGGLLLLRTADRDCAAGLVDRLLPGWVRGHAWRRLRPGEPGPYPAVYEEIVSARGIEGFAVMRGLVIAERQATRSHDAAPGPWGVAYRLACGLVARASRGRYTGEHDELLVVVRRPQDRFARVL